MDLNRTNTILYCVAWRDTVQFFRERVGLEVSFEPDWFVEFVVGGSFLSIADAARVTVGESRGQGSLSAGRSLILKRRVELKTSLSVRSSNDGGVPVVDFWDPEGHRVELWENSRRLELPRRGVPTWGSGYPVSGGGVVDDQVIVKI